MQDVKNSVNFLNEQAEISNGTKHFSPLSFGEFEKFKKKKKITIELHSKIDESPCAPCARVHLYYHDAHITF